MPTLQIEHRVRDYDAWKQAFDSDPVDRAGGGVRRYRVWRLTDDPAFVIIDLDFDTLREAEDFRGRLEAMWEHAGPRLGLEELRVRIVDVVESNDV